MYADLMYLDHFDSFDVYVRFPVLFVSFCFVTFLYSLLPLFFCILDEVAEGKVR